MSINPLKRNKKKRKTPSRHPPNTIYCDKCKLYFDDEKTHKLFVKVYKKHIIKIS